MPILVEQMSVWDIGFRWAGYDPRKFYFRIPIEVENNFRTLMDAIHSGDIECMSISLEKREYAKDEVKESIYYWMDDIFKCIWGQKINRQLMRWATFERHEFMAWCEAMNIQPLPEFWFPQGWNYQYELPEHGMPPGYRYMLKDMDPETRKDFLQAMKEQNQKAPIGNEPKTRINQELRIVCQQIAKVIWTKEPDRTIASVVNDPLIQEYGGARSYNDETVRDWVRAVAPEHVKNRPGRPRKNRD